MSNAQINTRIADINKRLIVVSSSMLEAYGTEKGAALAREYDHLIDELVGLEQAQNPDADWEADVA